MTIYHALKCNGGYKTFAYDLFGTLRFFSFSKTLEFLSKSRLTEKSCNRLCNRLNMGLKKHKEDKDNFIVAIKKAKQHLAAGENPEDVFDYCSVFHEGFARVELNDKFNYIDRNGKYLSKTWFDDCGIFYEGFAWVKLSDKCNFIDNKGKYLSKTWFDGCGSFHEGFALVELNGKDYLLRKDGVLCDYDTKEPIKMEE